MLRIVCVKSGAKYGADYVNILRDMVLRNLPEGMEGEFVCFTDDVSDIAPSIVVRPLPTPGLEGWYNKIALFQDGLFEDGDSIVYLDLDTVITGPLDAIVAYDGPFAILRDFYRPNGLQSSVMAWAANTVGYLWDEFKDAKFPRMSGGDQAWIERQSHILRPNILQDMFPGDFYSYKVHGRFGIPKGGKICVFHGEPRPHEVTTDWVPMVWKIGGGTSAELVVESNIPIEQIARQIRSAKARMAPWLHLADAHDGIAMVIAGGPSLARDMGLVRAMAAQGVKLFTVNGSYAHLMAQGQVSDFHVLLDGRVENADFVPPETTAQQFYSSQCHPDVLSTATNLTLWHPYFDGVVDIVGEDDDSAFIGGGTTVGLKAVIIAFTLGFRKIHMFGFDSSYHDGNGHAYSQPLNAKDRVLDVSFDGAEYKCAPWMITQAEDFETLMPEMMAMGAEIFVHGHGLIPDMAKAMGTDVQLSPPDLRAQAILSRLGGVKAPVGAEIGVFAGDLSKRLLSRPDLKLYMVDSWTAHHAPQYAESGDFHATLTQQEQDEYAKHAMAVVSFAQKRAEIIRKPSVEAAGDIPDGALDFAFIDADHSYEGCKADILAWAPKVKDGGIICGHDYENTDFPCFGVTRAVDELVAEFGLELERGENFTWFAIKRAA